MTKSIKAKVMWMNGGRVDGYFYVGIEGTDLVACDNGHPCFPSKFEESIELPEKKAKALCRKINGQLRKATKVQTKFTLSKWKLKTGLDRQFAQRAVTGP